MVIASSAPAPGQYVYFPGGITTNPGGTDLYYSYVILSDNVGAIDPAFTEFGVYDRVIATGNKTKLFSSSTIAEYWGSSQTELADLAIDATGTTMYAITGDPSEQTGRVFDIPLAAPGLAQFASVANIDSGPLGVMRLGRKRLLYVLLKEGQRAWNA